MSNTTTSAAFQIAQYAATVKYEDIPGTVLSSTKKSIVDTIGVALAGSSLGEEDGYSDLIGIIREAGGKEESTIIGFGGKVPAWMAAFANGALSRVLHLDDIYDEAVTHSSCTTVPACLALAERIGGISGKEFITAVTVGNDITSRMGLSICQRGQGWKPDWYQTTLHGVFGATAACGRLLGLNTERMQNAMGISLNQAAGTLEQVGMSSGFAAKAAVLSALMADRGISGAKESLEGKAGFYPVYYKSDYNRDKLVDGIGRRFENLGISFKAWPGLRYFHPYIDATLRLVKENDINVGDIQRITIYVAGYVESCCTDLEKRRNPQTLDEANWSLPYLVAVAAAKRRVGLSDICPDALHDPTVKKILSSLETQHDVRYNISNAIGPAKVDIVVTSGDIYSKEISVAYGHPTYPLTDDDFVTKFVECAGRSIRRIPDARVQGIINTGGHLEDLADIRQLMAFLQ